MINTINKIHLKGLTKDELKEYFLSIGEKPFRSEQLFDWIHNKLEFDFNGMLNISKELRNKLEENCTLNTLKLTDIAISGTTGTRKFLYETYDERKIETVLIPGNNGRNTLCISTQVGCPLDCKFCATGLMGYKRNLTSAEIIDQYLLSAKETGKENITNIVYMGMGEPLLNFKNTISSLKILTSAENLFISKNRITVSTAGIAPKIIELADSGVDVKLALSLHSVFEENRTRIMPINDKYSLKENIDACKYYADKTGTRITFEYTMLNGVNDTEEDVKGLVKLCSHIPSKINIIPFNSIKHMAPDGLSAELESTPLERIEEFADKLRSKNIFVMLRDTKGSDISAACGQLAIKHN